MPASNFVIVPDAPEVREHIDAINHFSDGKNVPGLIIQYGSERALAEANFAAYTEMREGTYLLYEGGERVARGKWGLVVREDA